MRWLDGFSQFVGEGTRPGMSGVIAIQKGEEVERIRKEQIHFLGAP